MLNPVEFAGREQSGEKREDVLAALHDRGLTITEAIKASMHLFGLGLGDAKMLVASHPSWRPTAEAAAPFHEELIRAFQEIAPEVETWRPATPRD